MSAYRPIRGKVKATTPPEEWELIHLQHRINYLPIALENTWRKLRALEEEARRYGMDAILKDKAHFDAAWDREMRLAKAKAALRGQETTMEGGL